MQSSAGEHYCASAVAQAHRSVILVRGPLTWLVGRIDWEVQVLRPPILLVEASGTRSDLQHEAQSPRGVRSASVPSPRRAGPWHSTSCTAPSGTWSGHTACSGPTRPSHRYSAGTTRSAYRQSLRENEGGPSVVASHAANLRMLPPRTPHDVRDSQPVVDDVVLVFVVFPCRRVVAAHEEAEPSGSAFKRGAKSFGSS